MRMKGQNMSMLQTGVLGVLVIVFTIIIGSQILGTLRDVEFTTLDKETANESLTADTTSPYTVANLGTGIRNGSIIVTKLNDTGGSGGILNVTFVEGNDYNFHLGVGVLTWVNESNGYNNSLVNITYTSIDPQYNGEYNITATGLDSVGNFADYFVIIAVVAIIVFVLAILIRAFGKTSA